MIVPDRAKGIIFVHVKKTDEASMEAVLSDNDSGIVSHLHQGICDNAEGTSRPRVLKVTSNRGITRR